MKWCRVWFVLAAVLAGPVLAVAQGTTPVPLTAAAAPPSAKAQEDVMKAERDRFTAMVKADTGALEKLLAPELSYTHTNAQVQDKGTFIADIKSGVIKYISIEPADTHVTVFGNTAVVTGTAAMHVLQNGNDVTLKIRYTNMQVDQHGSWQVVAWQATRVP